MRTRPFQQVDVFTATAWLAHGGVPQDPALIVASLGKALGLRPDQIRAAQHLNNGPRHFGLLLDSSATVLELAPDWVALRAWMREVGVSGVGVAALESTAHDSPLIRRSNREARAFANVAAAQTEPGLEVRFFFDSVVVAEDPVTGSFNASLAQWLIADGHAPKTYVASQGTCIDGNVQL